MPANAIAPLPDKSSETFVWMWHLVKSIFLLQSEFFQMGLINAVWDPNCLNHGYIRKGKIGNLSFLSLSLTTTQSSWKHKNQTFTTHRRSAVYWLRDVELFFNYLSHCFHSKGRSWSLECWYVYFCLWVTRQHASVWTLVTTPRQHIYVQSQQAQFSLPHGITLPTPRFVMVQAPCLSLFLRESSSPQGDILNQPQFILEHFLIFLWLNTNS